MNLLLLTDRDGGPKRWRIRDHRATHLRDVLNVQPGQQLRVGFVNGPLGTGRVVRRTASEVELEVEITKPAPEPELSLVLAVPRPKMLKGLLRNVGAFGLRRLRILRTWRTRPEYLTSPWLQRDAMEEKLLEGMSQGQWTHLPQVEVFHRFEAAFESGLLEPGTNWVADPGADPELARLGPLPDAPVQVAIGPEGGWTPYEVERFRTEGFLPVRSGRAILRTDVAAVALLAQASLLRRQGSVR